MTEAPSTEEVMKMAERAETIVRPGGFGDDIAKMLRALAQDRDAWKDQAGYEDHDGRFHSNFDSAKTANAMLVASMAATKKAEQHAANLEAAGARLAVQLHSSMLGDQYPRSEVEAALAAWKKEQESVPKAAHTYAELMDHQYEEE